MPTVNEQLLDAEIGHQVDLQRYSNGVVRRIIGLLNRVDPDLFAQLGAALERLPADSFTVDRLESQLFSVRQLNLQAYQQIDRQLTDELQDLAAYEATFQQQAFEAAIPAQIQARLAIAPVPAEQAYSAALSQPFRGRLLREWASSMDADRMARIRDAVRIGYVEQQTIAQIVKRIRGTKALGYSDGIIEVDRRNAEAVVRTAISHTAGFTRDRFYSANADLVKAVQWVSTLDSRTSEPCRVRDGLKYTTDQHKPIGHTVPWLGGPGRLHWQCRSTSAPVLKSWRELGMDIDEMGPGTRASMDGQVPADMTYAQWLAKQSHKRQTEILGPSRAALVRTGGLPIEKFANDKGKWLTLEQLKAKEQVAFKASGLDLEVKPPPGVPKDEIARFLASPDKRASLMQGLYRGNGHNYEAQLAKVSGVKESEGYKAAPDSLSAVRYYTGSGYRPINQRMRESGGTLEDRQFTALTMEGIDGIPANRNTIWRAPTKSVSRANEWWDRALIGAPLDMGDQLLSFSRSVDISAAWGLNSDLLIKVAKPGVGAYIDPLSMNRGEKEVLLPRGLVFKVIGKSTQKVGERVYRVIELEMESGG